MSLRSVARVRHPALVPIVDVSQGEQDDVWVCSQPAHGVTLQRLLEVASLTPSQVAHITCGIQDGLGALYRSGLAHGGLDASNVHIGADGQVRLSDGGLPAVMRRLSLPHSGRRFGGGADSSRSADVGALADLVTSMAGDQRRQGGAWRHPRARALCHVAGTAARAMAELGAQRAAVKSVVEDNLEALREAASRLLPDDTEGRAADELAELVRTLSPRPRPPLSPVSVHSRLTARPAPRFLLLIPQMSRRTRRWAAAGALLLLISLFGLGVALKGKHLSQQPVVRPLATAVGAAASRLTHLLGPLSAQIRGG